MNLKAGRNEPCPCGSGRKYKRCCLRNGPPPEPLSFSDEVRARAWEALLAFGNRNEFAAHRDRAKALYFGEEFDYLPDDARQLVFDDEPWAANLVFWLLYEATFEGPARTIVAQFLARMGHTLRLSERRYLEAMGRSHLRLYEVEEVTRDVGLRLRDCWSDEHFDVRERLFTHSAVRGMVVALRLRLDPDGTHVIDGPFFPSLTHVDNEDILDELRDDYEMVMETDQNADGRFNSSFAPVIAQHYVYEVLLRPEPEMTTSTGDPLLFCRVIFKILDEAALRAGLESVKQVRRDEDGSLTWIRGKAKIVHATFVFEKGRLVVETASARRAEAALALVRRQAGAAVRYQKTETTDPRQMLEEYRNRPESERERDAREVPEIPPEVEAQVLQQSYDKHYRAWVDLPVPALADFTPRQAVKMPGLRPTLVGLLKDLAVMSERARVAGRFAYDASWLWSELGLDPSE